MKKVECEAIGMSLWDLYQMALAENERLRDEIRELKGE